MAFIGVALLAFALVAAVTLASLAGRARFVAIVASDIAGLAAGARGAVGPAQLAARWEALPGPVQRYLRYAIPKACAGLTTVRMKHDGYFRTKPGQRWLAIRGEEHFTVAQPGFVWRGSVPLAPLLWIEARDRLVAGRGNMLVKFNSLLSIAAAAGPEIDQAAHLRWLSEAVWFPYGFIGDRIRWDPIDDGSARATVLYDGLPASLVVDVDAEGKLVRLRGARYRDVGGGHVAPTSWVGRCSDYRDFDGLRVPSSVEAAWELEDGEFSYARFRVKTLECDVSEGR